MVIVRTDNGAQADKAATEQAAQIMRALGLTQSAEHHIKCAPRGGGIIMQDPDLHLWTGVDEKGVIAKCNEAGLHIYYDLWHIGIKGRRIYLLCVDTIGRENWDSHLRLAKEGCVAAYVYDIDRPATSRADLIKVVATHRGNSEYLILASEGLICT